MISKLNSFIRDLYSTLGPIPLHSPVFLGNEKRYAEEAIESTFVSSVGTYVTKFEHSIGAYCGSLGAVAVNNGTAALHVSLMLSGVKTNDLVITQSLTFVATCNAISYCGADPLFVDVDTTTLGLSPEAMEQWLIENAKLDNDGVCRRKKDDRIIRACVVMHSFGHPSDLNGLLKVANKWGLELIEDAAESLGSLYNDKHTGTFGKFGTLSFNGNKIITTGGGGMILCDEQNAANAKHLTTTAKLSHRYEFVHDRIGYNYRMPNINAALGCAQLEQLDNIIKTKRSLANAYRDFFSGSSIKFVEEPKNCRSNYWLVAVVCENEKQRNEILEGTNDEHIMTRPVWTAMHKLSMFSDCERGCLRNTEWLASRLVNMPSGVEGL